MKNCIDIDNEEAVSNLLLLSAQEQACNCKTIREDQSDDIAGWHSFKKWKVDKSSPGKTRNKTSNSRRSNLNGNANLLGNTSKGTVIVKRDDLSHSSQTSIVSNLHILESPEDHVNFYTEHYASTTKGAVNGYREDELYNPRPGDVHALGLRLKILEFLSDAYQTRKHKGNELSTCAPAPFSQAMLRLRPPDVQRDVAPYKRDVAYGKSGQDRTTSSSASPLGVRKYNSDFLMVVSSSQNRKLKTNVPRLPERPAFRPMSTGNATAKTHRTDEISAYRLRKNDVGLHSRQSTRKDKMVMEKINIDRSLSNANGRNRYSIPNRYIQDSNSYFKRPLNKVTISYTESEINQ